MNKNLSVIIGGQVITKFQLLRDVEKCKKWIIENTKFSAMRFAVSIKNQYWHWVMLLAILRLGKECASIFSPKQVPESLINYFSVWVGDELNDHPGVELLFNPDDLVDYENIERVDLKNINENIFELDIDERSRRLILTSGTTGKPKLVSLSAHQLRIHLHETAMQVGDSVNVKTKLLHLMGIDTMGGFLMPLVTWAKGGTVLLPSQSENSHAVHLPLYQSNMLCASPARLKSLLDQYPGVWPGHSERKIRTAGSRLHITLRDALLVNMGTSIQITYGSTELGGVSSCDSAALDHDPRTAGKINENVTVEIIDAEGNRLPFGQYGIIRCKTKAMAQCYEDEELSSHFVDGWFYPGDIGTITDDGWLSISGRNSDIINLGGHKVSAVDLESRLLHINGIDDICVVSINRLGSDELTAAIVANSTENLFEIRKKIDDLMPNNLQCHVVKVPSLPRNNMGKLLRNQISSKLTEMMNRNQKN